MNALEEHVVQCPSCWSEIELLLDCTESDQQYVEDCQVCCHPMSITLSISDSGDINLTVTKENA